MLNKLTSLTALALLTACGGGGTDTPVGTTEAPAQVTETTGDPSDTTADAMDTTAETPEPSGDTTDMDDSPDVVVVETSIPVEVPVSGAQFTPRSGGGLRIDEGGGFIDNLDIPSPGNIDGEQQFLTGSYGLTAVQFVGDHVSIAAAGGTVGLRPGFDVIAGTTEAIPAGNATFAGHYTVASSNAIAGHGALDMQYAFFNKTLIGTSNDNRLTVFGLVDTNGVVSGAVDFDGTDFDLNGGLYGSDADEVAAGFSGSTLGGYVYGQRQ